MAMSLKAHRVDAEMTILEVCEAMDIKRTTLINYENFNTIPNIETAKRFAELYNTTVDDIRWVRE